MISFNQIHEEITRLVNAIGGGGGGGDVSAEDVSYDNTESEIAATDVQSAIDINSLDISQLKNTTSEMFKVVSFWTGEKTFPSGANNSGIIVSIPNKPEGYTPISSKVVVGRKQGVAFSGWFITGIVNNNSSLRVINCYSSALTEDVQMEVVYIRNDLLV